MKKTAERASDSHLHVICPFCGYYVNHLPSTVTPWCSGCGVEFYWSRKGEVIFDNKRTTASPIAKAFQQAGGVRMGKAKQANAQAQLETQEEG